MTEIKLENVSYAYDEQQILKDINLEVEAGQVVAILFHRRFRPGNP